MPRLDHRHVGPAVVLPVELQSVSSCRALMARCTGPKTTGSPSKRSRFYGSRDVLSLLTWSSRPSTVSNDIVSASTSRAATSRSSRPSCSSS